MDTEIRFLKVLERDLQTLAEREVALRPAPTRRSVRWKGWLGAVASLLVLAFAVGALAQLAGGGTAASSAAGTFSTVGSAVNDAGDQALLPFPGGQQGSRHGDLSAPNPGPKSPDLTKIMRDGTITLSVPDGSFKDELAAVVAIAHRNGGFVLSSQTEGSTTGTMTIRVPASHFDAAVGQVARLGVVESSTVTAKDVTNQYVDLKAHLQNLVGRRVVLRDLLARTTTIGESLTVYNELNDVQLQIDQIQGQLRYLNNQVAVSTLTVDLREASAPDGTSETQRDIHNPSLSRAWDRAVQGFFGIIATIVVGLGYLVPVAVIAGLGYGIVRLARRRGHAAS
jgi:hypothetical protein